MTGIDSGLLFTAWAMGFLGSTHCVGMCGGISAALSFMLPPEARQGWRLPAYQLAYNSGRILTYTLMGALFGLLGAGLLAPWAGLVWPRVLAGLLMIALGLYLAGWWTGLQRLEKVGGGIWKYVQPLTRHLIPVNNPLKAVIAGGLWGFLPCGLVYSALGLALARSDAGASAATMLAFGLGTLPTLLVTGSAAGKLREFMQSVNVRRLAGVMVVGFGLWTIITPFLHAGHHHGGHEMPDATLPSHGMSEQEHMDHTGMDHSKMDHSQMQDMPAHHHHEGMDMGAEPARQP